jgi:hypothetical protein
MRAHVVLTILPLLIAPAAFAHGGGLNAEGCHNNRKTGDYHCHRPPSRTEPSPALSKAQPLYGGSAGAYYANCSAARAVGAAPIRRGEPGYAPHLDRDNDGVACE